LGWQSDDSKNGTNRDAATGTLGGKSEADSLRKDCLKNTGEGTTAVRTAQGLIDFLLTRSKKRHERHRGERNGGTFAPFERGGCRALSEWLDGLAETRSGKGGEQSAPVRTAPSANIRAREEGSRGDGPPMLAPGGTGGNLKCESISKKKPSAGRITPTKDKIRGEPGTGSAGHMTKTKLGNTSRDGV